METSITSLDDRRSKLGGIIKWAGGKTALSRAIVPIILSRRPNRLIEPFAGSAAVFYRSGISSAILGDVNTHLVQLHRAVKTDPNRLAAAIDDIAEAARVYSGASFKVFYYQMREQFPRPNRFENAALFIFLNRHCWNGLYRENMSGKFNTPLGSYDRLQPMPSRAQLHVASERFANAEIIEADFEATISKAQPGDFIYLDPPYIPVSSTARFGNYQAQAFSWRDQIRLKRALYALKEREIDFALSNSYQRLTVALYADFPRYVLDASGSINSRGASRQSRQELLVTSFRTKQLGATVDA